MNDGWGSLPGGITQTQAQANNPALAEAGQGRDRVVMQTTVNNLNIRRAGERGHAGSKPPDLIV